MIVRFLNFAQIHIYDHKLGKNEKSEAVLQNLVLAPSYGHTKFGEIYEKSEKFKKGTFKLNFFLIFDLINLINNIPG